MVWVRGLGGWGLGGYRSSYGCAGPQHVALLGTEVEGVVALGVMVADKLAHDFSALAEHAAAVVGAAGFGGFGVLESPAGNIAARAGFRLAALHDFAGCFVGEAQGGNLLPALIKVDGGEIDGADIDVRVEGGFKWPVRCRWLRRGRG